MFADKLVGRIAQQRGRRSVGFDNRVALALDDQDGIAGTGKDVLI